MKREKKINAYSALILFLILGLSSFLYARETHKEAGKEKEGVVVPPPTVIQRTILSDGTIEFRYSDGTIKRISEATVMGGAEKTEAASPSAAKNSDPMFPEASHPELFDAPTKEKYLAALGEYYDYRVSGLKHRQRVFDWQFISSRVIFIVVLVLVFAGICFAAVQFYIDLRRKIDEVTQIDASVQGVKVSSPVLGVIILAISLAFFYLYLVYVYPITNIF